MNTRLLQDDLYNASEHLIAGLRHKSDPHIIAGASRCLACLLKIVAHQDAPTARAILVLALQHDYPDPPTDVTTSELWSLLHNSYPCADNYHSPPPQDKLSDLEKEFDNAPDNSHP